MEGSRNRWRPVLAAAIATLLAAGCSGSSYLLARPGNCVGAPADLGAGVLLGVDFLATSRDEPDRSAREGDVVTLLAATPVGLTGDFEPRALAYRGGDGAIGAVASDATLVDGGPSAVSMGSPLEGFRYTAADGPIEVVFEVTVDEPGVYHWDAVDLRYVVGGRVETIRTGQAGTVWAGGAERTDPCDPTQPDA